MKKIVLVFVFLTALFIDGQIAHFNQYPTMHVNDEVNLTGASFAYSLRNIKSAYTGPLVRLRRSSDNATQDFYAGSTGKLNVAAVSSWAGNSTLYVHTWYDQSTAGRNATQTTGNWQPTLVITNPQQPEIKFDGIVTYLRVTNGNIQNVTNAGKQGSIFTVMKATTKAQTSFGAIVTGTRWSLHVNWSDGKTYFDPGSISGVVNTNRSFVNTANVNIMTQYSFIAGSDSRLTRVNAVEVQNTTNTGAACTLTYDFLIGAGASTATSASGYASNSFQEFIMFPTDVDVSVYSSFESDQMNFWGL